MIVGAKDFEEVIMKSIKMRLAIYFTCIIFAAVIGLTVLAVMSSQSIVRSEADNTLKTMAEDAGTILVSRLDTQTTILKTIASNSAIKSMNWDDQRIVLTEQLSDSGYDTLLIVDMTGHAVDTSGAVAELAEREYVKSALAGTVAVSDVLLSSVTGEPVIMVAVPIYQDDTVVGALVGSHDGNFLSETISDMGYGEQGYCYMINRQGVIIAHPDKEKVVSQFSPIQEAETDQTMESTAEAIKRMIAEDEGVTEYTLNGKTLLAAFTRIEGTKWSIAIIGTKDDVLKDIAVVKYQLGGLSLVILILGVVAVLIIGGAIAAPITSTIRYAETIAALDITGDIQEKHLKRKDEIGKLALSLQNIKVSLYSIVREIASSAEQMSASSEELTASTEATSLRMGEIAETVTGIAKGATDQAVLTQAGAQKVEELGKGIKEDQIHLDNMNQMTKHVSGIIDSGMQDMMVLSVQTDKNNKTGKDVQTVINKTDESAKLIGNASQMIASIADQTNLLALNAAIEAARAGDAGRGFAVVAEEIRKLAEQSAASTKEIDAAIHELLNNSKEAVDSIAKMTDIITEQTDSVRKNRENYEGIRDAVVKMEQGVQKLNETGKQMNLMRADIVREMEGLSAIAEENSASTEEVTASIEEQASSVEEIANTSESLSSLAVHLHNSVSRFKM